MSGRVSSGETAQTVEAILARLRPRLEEALTGGWDSFTVGADVRIRRGRPSFKIVVRGSEWPRRR